MAFFDFCRQPFLYAFIYHEVVVYVLISKVFIYSQKCSLTLVRQKLVLSAYGEWVELLSPHNRRTKHRIYFNVLMKFSYIFIYYIYYFLLFSLLPRLLSSTIAFVLFYYTRLWTQLCYHRNAAHSSFVYVYSKVTAELTRTYSSRPSYV